MSVEGAFHNQQSPFFQEEFPTLSGGEKSPQTKKEEEKEPQYGPGPSLRPQSECFHNSMIHMSAHDNLDACILGSSL